MRKIGFLAFVVLLSGCASQPIGPKLDPPSQPAMSANLARIYIMRDSVTYVTQAPAVVAANIFIDGKPVGALKNGRFLVADVIPGEHTIIAASSDQIARTITVNPSAVTYIAVWDRTRMIVPLMSEISAPVSERDGRVWGLGMYADEIATRILPTLVGPGEL
jgi:Protein of unknown function (DUF2846)